VIVLDASVLIAHLDGDDLHHPRASALLLELVNERLMASVITLAEVLVGPARAGQLDRATTAVRLLGVTGANLEIEAPPRLAHLLLVTSLKLPDCCVLLAAEQVGGEIATFDHRLGAAARDLGFVVWD
jgi:predicted nucleic acid-binding protein